jgi:ADP-ribosylglycohydrolase
MTKLPPDYDERVYAGVLGKIIGVYLGRPFEQWSHAAITEKFGEIRGYVHDQLGVPLVVTDDDISGTFTFLRALADYGPQVSSKQIGESWLNYIIENRTILWWGGMGVSTEHTAYLRLKHGMSAPESGSIATNGKTVAEQIGSQIFIDGWGLVSPGNPEQAADYATRAASVSHDGEATYGAVIVACLVALAFVETDLNLMLDKALTFIPEDSVIARLIADVRVWHATGDTWQQGLQRIQAKYGYDKYGGGCHIVPNHALVIHALLHGGDDFSEALKIVNTCGWDTDCNSANVGCILGVKLGLAGIDKGYDWRGPVADRLYLPTADGGRGVSDAVHEARRISVLGRRLNGEAVDDSTQPLFDFRYPGSVQGFTVDGGTVNHEEHDGKRGLLVTPNSHTARASTPTFLLPSELNIGGYGVYASPKLYPSQTVRAILWAKDEADVSLFVDAYNAEDALVSILGPLTTFKAGEMVTLEWLVPDTGGFPIAKVGIETTGQVHLQSLTWEGCPSTSLKALKEGSVWKRAWVNGVSDAGSWDDTLHVVQNEGTGLYIQGCREWSDYEVEAEITFNMQERAGVAVHVQGMRRWIGLFLCRDGFVRLIQSLDGETVLAEGLYPYQFGESHRLRLGVIGQDFRAYVDSELILSGSAEVPLLTEGAVAFVVREGKINSKGLVVTANR